MISLAEKHPELEAEWDDSNAPLTPWNVSYGSNKKVRWKGMCGHTWVAIIKNRANGHGCPVCTGNTIEAGINDFASLSPEIAAEWSEKNHDKPSNFTNHSPHLAWWKCRKCGYEWQARV